MPNSHSVLIVEDDAAIRDVFADLLRSEGHEVCLAGNGEEAMELLTDGCSPCLIFLDLLMPILDGYGFASRLAAIPELASIPLVILSAQPPSASDRTPPAARERLTKPVALDAVLATVEQYCANPR